jgi:hypothetical protein
MNRLSALVACAAAVLLAQGAHAAATEVDNLTDPIYHPYQAYASATCTLEGVCPVQFPAITSAVTLITHVSCTLQSTKTNIVAYAALNQGPEEPASGPFNVLPVFQFASVGGGTSLGINAQTYMFFTSGQTPDVVFQLENALPFGAVACTLSGYSH